MFRHLMVVAALAAVCGCAPGARADTRDAFESHGDWDFFIGTIDGIERTSCIVGTRSVRTEMFLALTPDPDGDDDTAARGLFR